MNNQEAQLILQAYRLGGQDAADPQFQEALEQLQRDPDLERWFAQERAIETRIQARLRAAVKPPEHLKANLLAQRKIVRPVVWWRRPAWLAAAAAVALLAAIATSLSRRSSELEFAAFRQAMAQHATRLREHVTFMAHDVSKIQQWLKERNIDANFDLPAALRDTPVQGCRVVDWKGQKVTLICFLLNGKEHVDLFVIDRTQFRDFTPSETPQFARADGLTTASWARGEKTYLLASTADESVIRKWL